MRAGETSFTNEQLTLREVKWFSQGEEKEPICNAYSFMTELLMWFTWDLIKVGLKWGLRFCIYKLLGDDDVLGLWDHTLRSKGLPHKEGVTSVSLGHKCILWVLSITKTCSYPGISPGKRCRCTAYMNSHSFREHHDYMNSQKNIIQLE